MTSKNETSYQVTHPFCSCDEPMVCNSCMCNCHPEENMHVWGYYGDERDNLSMEERRKLPCKCGYHKFLRSNIEG